MAVITFVVTVDAQTIPLRGEQPHAFNPRQVEELRQAILQAILHARDHDGCDCDPACEGRLSIINPDTVRAVTVTR